MRTVTRDEAMREVVGPLKDAGFDVRLVGSVAAAGESGKDVDILLKLPEYPGSEGVFRRFERRLKAMGWEFSHSDESSEHPEWGVFHTYVKAGAVLDVFVDERDAWIREMIGRVDEQFRTG